jgi:hypothetical protein
MPLTLRPAGLSSPAYRDWLDYVIVEMAATWGASMRTDIAGPSCGGSGRTAWVLQGSFWPDLFEAADPAQGCAGGVSKGWSPIEGGLRALGGSQLPAAMPSIIHNASYPDSLRSVPCCYGATLQKKQGRSKSLEALVTFRPSC